LTRVGFWDDRKVFDAARKKNRREDLKGVRKMNDEVVKKGKEERPFGSGGFNEEEAS